MLRSALLLGCASAVAAKEVAADLPLAAKPFVKSELKEGTPGTVTHGSLTMLEADVPDDAEDYWPWESVEDFFRYSGLSYDDMEPTAEQKCTSPEPYREIYNVNDGQQERCFVAIRPTAAKEPLPVMFFAHGSGGSAYQCGSGTDKTGTTWVDVAKKNNFILACGEAVQSQATNNITGAILTGGIWSLPEVFNDNSGRSCDKSDNIEMAYMYAVMDKMNEEPEFNTSAFFYHGCSEGSAYTQYQAVCWHQNHPDNFTAFATHSTGLKIKGDGLRFPPCYTDPSVEWGECSTCKYWPTVPGKFDGLKACIFDNTEDPQAQDPLFYKSSEQMADYYKKEGSRYVTNYGSGGHCVQHSFEAIAECMDDGTGRLINGGSGCQDIAPDSNYTCEQQKSFGKCNRTWMDGYCCKTCFDCSSTCSN